MHLHNYSKVSDSFHLQSGLWGTAGASPACHVVKADWHLVEVQTWLGQIEKKDNEPSTHSCTHLRIRTARTIFMLWGGSNNWHQALGSVSPPYTNIWIWKSQSVEKQKLEKNQRNLHKRWSLLLFLPARSGRLSGASVSLDVCATYSRRFSWCYRFPPSKPADGNQGNSDRSSRHTCCVHIRSWTSTWKTKRMEKL